MTPRINKTVVPGQKTAEFAPSTSNTAPAPSGYKMPPSIPHDMLAEMSVLGAMMFDSSVAVDKASAIIGKEDFYSPQLAEVWDAMLVLHERMKPVDIVTLRDELSRRGTFERIGGLNFLMQLGDIEFTTRNVEYYAEIVAQKAFNRRIIQTAQHMMQAAMADELSVEELAVLSEKGVLEATAKRRKKHRTLKQVLNDFADDLDELYRNGGQLPGLSTGYRELDAILSGLHAGEVTVIAGRPGTGKSSLSTCLAINAAEQNGSVVIVSLEMPAKQIVGRMCCTLGGIDAQKMRTGSLSEDEWQKWSGAQSKLWDMAIQIDDDADTTISSIRSRARQVKAENGLDLLIVDYIQLVQGDAQNEQNRVLEISRMTRGLKALAMELDIPVVALAQINRSVEARADKRPMLSDLRESGSIENDADNVILLYNPGYYERDRERMEVEPVEIIVAKQRSGPTGTVKLGWQGQYTRFVELDLEHKF